MVISNEYRYVFVELPRTGSTAISKELQTHYDGRRILKKHSTYRDFLRQASPQEAGYFAFAGIRNPMDKLVSLYFKYKYDHRNYADPRTLRGSSIFVRKLMLSQFRFVHDRGASFPEFFRRYYRLPYDDWSSLDHRRMNFVIRFEHLADDFAQLLQRLGVTQKRTLPLANKTNDREADFWSYYPPGIRGRAKWVFGPYFRRWSYDFPIEWDEPEPRGSDFAFHIANVARHAYWRYLRQ